MPPFTHIPARTFGALENEEEDDDGGEHGRAHHEPPVQASYARCVFDAVECEVGDEAEHDAEGGPDLPLHDEGAADGFGGAFGSVDGDCSRLWTYTEA